MMEWCKLASNRKRTILDEIASRAGLPGQAIEKDWWVTQCLRAVFQTSVSEHIVFKGGTSLSKGWGLIERFSEDIDLSVSRDYLGYGGELSSNQLKKLRRASFGFASDTFSGAIQSSLEEIGISRDEFQLTVPIRTDSDVDPQVIFVTFQSIFDPLDYLPSRVKIEVGARAMMEPSEARSIVSLVGAAFPKAKFADSRFFANTVLPKRTFLEKIFLLHETLQTNPKSIGLRLARHLYDVERLMDTVHGSEALGDHGLFQTLANFRSRFNAIKHVDYRKHNFDEITFVPSPENREIWENDYRAFEESMIYGEKPRFDQLMARLETLQDRFRKAAANSSWL